MFPARLLRMFTMLMQSMDSKMEILGMQCFPNSQPPEFFFFNLKIFFSPPSIYFNYFPCILLETLFGKFFPTQV